jgi:hypothetical protein
MGDTQPTDRVMAMLAPVRDASRTFVTPAPAERERFAAWTEQAAKGTSVPAGVPAPFVVRPVTDDGGVFAVLESRATEGGGAYLFRRARPAPPVEGAGDGGGNREMIVEVPHSFADRFTLPIGLSLFRGARARALLTNTVHRYRGAGCAEDVERCAADMAHTDASYFHAAHEGVMRAHPGACVVALHGFDGAPEDPDAIVSAAGTAGPAEYATGILRGAFPGRRFALFPSEVNRLGGTTGTQAQQLREAGGCMLHIELGGAFRSELMNDRALRKRLAEALAAAIRQSPASVEGSPPAKSPVR